MKSTFLLRVISSLLLFTTFITTSAKDKDIISPAKNLIERQIGDKAQEIKFKKISPLKGKETYAIEAKNGVLTLKGSSTIAFSFAYHQYMRKAGGSMTTWSGSNNQIPQTWNNLKVKPTATPYDYRYFLNVCTFGYTTPYWDWSRWEKEIDFMALHGVNMPLATVASEAIAERVWTKLGLTKAEIRQFFTAPAHLPWHRMGNLNTFDGPLSDEWQSSQIALQHKIIDRMHELGMHPIAPAFAGFVPMAFAQKHPEIKMKHLRWGGFDESMNAYVLPPDSPYFEKIGKMFIQEWEKEFGKNTFYLSDSFNEMEIPLDPNDVEGKHKLLKNYGISIYNSIKAGNPDAVWVTQGWTFGYQHKFWDKESLRALLSGVPDDKMIIIDLGCDYPKWVWNTEQTWKVREGFFGKKWIFSYVPNFGGKTLATGELEMYATSSNEALHSAGKGNLIGFGSAPEGLENNEVVYEILGDMGWQDTAIDLDKWLPEYFTARYGTTSDKMTEAWKYFRKSVYASLYSYPRFTWQTVVQDRRRNNHFDANSDFEKGVKLFLECAEAMKGSQLYRNDAIEFAAYFISQRADNNYKQALVEDSKGNFTKAQEYIDVTCELLMKVDSLLASHPTCQLSSWVDYARNSGSTLAEKNAFESNAKRLITTWGGFQEDYAARLWSGLIKDYYIPRIKKYFSRQRSEVDNWEEEWIKSQWTNTSVPFADPINEAKKIIATFD
ncbi:MAG: alpha-N-acetylglucosaminidase [Muribaculaceae bacterium]|nr:alpha-N-acetylglucosaminidase [Muribaculaceae bacterium]